MAVASRESEILLDHLAWGWTILANVSHGDWTQQDDEWQGAVIKWRDKYHSTLDEIATARAAEVDYLYEKYPPPEIPTRSGKDSEILPLWEKPTFP